VLFWCWAESFGARVLVLLDNAGTVGFSGARLVEISEACSRYLSVLFLRSFGYVLLKSSFWILCWHDSRRS